jgi:transposase
MRSNLLKLVQEQNISVKQASERLGIKYSSAKNIVKIYKSTGRSHKLDCKKEEVWLVIKEDEEKEADLVYEVHESISNVPEIIKLLQVSKEQLLSPSFK